MKLEGVLGDLLAANEPCLLRLQSLSRDLDVKASRQPGAASSSTQGQLHVRFKSSRTYSFEEKAVKAYKMKTLKNIG
jgi:hypothetical protein